MEKISVIISTYHRDYDIIRRAIVSALNQDYNYIEVVVVDDNEDDSDYSKKIKSNITEFSDSVKYLTYQGNKGACFARNYGADNTSGEYLAFLDDDDVWHSDKMRKQLNLMKKNDYVLVGCNSKHIVVNKAGQVIKTADNVRTEKTEVTIKELLVSNVPGGCSFPLLKRCAFEEAGKFRVGLPSSQDYDLWIRMARIGGVGHVPEPLLDYYIHQKGRISCNVDGKVASYSLLIKEYGDLAEDRDLFIAQKYTSLARACFGYLHFCQGLKYTKKALIHRVSLSIILNSVSNIGYGIARKIKCLVYK